MSKAYLLGVDTGGTYTDAVVLDDTENRVMGTAKALTSRPDLAVGIVSAVNAAIAQADVAPADIAIVSLSTTLATNALVEGQGGRIALVFIGFDTAELGRAGLQDALAGDPVVILSGGHDHAGDPVAPLDFDILSAALSSLAGDVTGFAVAAQFATRNPDHEIAVRDFIRDATGKPVTCSHELSSGLGGPKRALTAVLNARLIGMIDGLITACETHLAQIGISAPLMVVRGDGALVAADVARAKPIETILSGPAASVAGASWLTGVADALVCDIGGTTTDVCLLQGGKPAIDPQGARVGPFRTMVEAVAMRTTGLGGDSAVHVLDGLVAGLRLGPRRVMPISLLATQHPAVVHQVLDRALAQDIPAADGGQFVVPLWDVLPQGLDPREDRIAARLVDGPQRLGQTVQTQMDNPALARMLDRGLVIIAGVTPSDAAHVLGLLAAWDVDAAQKALRLFARCRTGANRPIAATPDLLAQMIVGQLQAQTVDCLLQAGFAEDGRDWGDPAVLAGHPLAVAGLDQHAGVVQMQLRLGVPVVGLGAGAAAYYGAVGDRLGTQMILPAHAAVANAIGAVVSQVLVHACGTVTSRGGGVYVTYIDAGLVTFADPAAAMSALEQSLRAEVARKAVAAGVADAQVTVDRDLSDAQIEGQQMFIAADLRVTARGRPRISN